MTTKAIGFDWGGVLNGKPGKAFSEDANADDLNQDVLDLVYKLRGNGYRVGLLSNNSHEKADEMRQSGLDKHFDAFDISAETGLVKPEYGQRMRLHANLI